MPIIMPFRELLVQKHIVRNFSSACQLMPLMIPLLDLSCVLRAHRTIISSSSSRGIMRAYRVYSPISVLQSNVLAVT